MHLFLHVEFVPVTTWSVSTLHMISLVTGPVTRLIVTDPVTNANYGHLARGPVIRGSFLLGPTRQHLKMKNRTHHWQDGSQRNHSTLRKQQEDGEDRRKPTRMDHSETTPRCVVDSSKPLKPTGIRIYLAHFCKRGTA